MLAAGWTEEEIREQEWEQEGTDRTSISISTPVRARTEPVANVNARAINFGAESIALELDGEDDEEMNRAILLSLQAVQPVTGTTANSTVGDNPPEDSVNAIVAMGFDRADAILALRACQNNVENAIIRILNSN